MRLRALGLLALALLAAPVTAQEAADAYETGRERLRAGDDRGAVESFSRAIAKESRETKHFLISGTHYDVYVPHLYLGLALKRLGESDRARRELLETRRQSVSNQFPALKRDLDAAIEELTLRLVLPTPVLPTVTTTPAPLIPAPTPEPRPTPSPATAPAPMVSRPAVPSPGPGVSATPFVRLAKSPETIFVPRDERSLLRQALREFLEGHYGRAALALEAPALSTNEVARLFAAYALCGEYLAAGEKDRAVLNRAATLYRSVPEKARRGARAGISPRILETLAGWVPVR